MPIDDLSSVPGLEEKHSRVLARHQITTFRALVFADRRAMHRAMSNIRPRPTLEQLACWQDHARSRLSEPAVDPSDWHPAASFAVIFAQRQVDGVWERQLQAERTEVEPELRAAVWPGWDCSPICDWMLEQVGQLDITNGDDAIGSESDQGQAGLPDQSRSALARPVTRGRLRIGNAAVIDASGRADLIRAGELVPSPLRALTPPARVVLTVTGAPPGHEVCAVVRFRAHGQPSWHSDDPAIAGHSGQARLGLSPGSAGQYALKLLAWVPDAAAYPVSVTVPEVTVKQAVGS